MYHDHVMMCMIMGYNEIKAIIYQKNSDNTGNRLGRVGTRGHNSALLDAGELINDRIECLHRCRGSRSILQASRAAET